MTRITTPAPRCGWQSAWAAAALMVAALTAQPLAAADAGTVVARVGDTEITLGHVVGLMARLPEEFRQMPDDVLLDGIVEQLVEQTAVAQSVSEPFNTRLQIDLDNSRREVIVNDTLARVIDEAVTEDALRALYAEMYLDAEPERQFSAAHILVETEEEARELAAALADGADFAHLARERSLDPGSAEAGGALGWFGPAQMVEPFADAVQQLEPGETSAPVETRFGWHLILLEDTRLAETPGFEVVQDRLTAQLQRNAVTDHIAAARAATTVEVMLEGIDPAVLRDQTILDD